MFTQTFTIAEYQPAFKAEQSGKLREQMAIVDGRNFAWEGGAVVSAYANAPYAPLLEDNEGLGGITMRHPGLFTIANRTYLFTLTNVIRRNANGTVTVVYTYPTETVTPAPDPEDPPIVTPIVPPTGPWDEANYCWTTAYVGTKHFFCHPQVGVFWYDQFENAWGQLTNDHWTGPVYAICMADNRLVVLLEDVVTWSWVDLGTKFDEIWQSGSGVQSLALIKYGQPYTVQHYNGGFLTFTSMGVMISVPNNDQAIHPEGDRLVVGGLVFKHEEVSFEDCALGPAAVTSVGTDMVIWLTQHGLRTFSATQGGGFGGLQNWQAPMGAFYHETMIPGTDGLASDTFMLSYCHDLHSVFLSHRGIGGNYVAAHVFQMDYERWGSFDYPHRVIGPGNRGTIDGVNYQFPSFINADGNWRDFIHGPVTDSWIKFSPVRLQLPQENILPTTTVISVQEIRLGTERAPSQSIGALPFGLTSNWQIQRFRSREATKCEVMLSGGWDENTQNLDQGEYAMLKLANLESAIYVCDVTGITHSLYIECADPDHHFTISHVEMTFFFAGQL